NPYEKMLWQMGSAIRDIASLIRPMRAGTVLPIAIERRPDKEEPDEYCPTYENGVSSYDSSLVAPCFGLYRTLPSSSQNCNSPPALNASSRPRMPPMILSQNIPP